MSAQDNPFSALRDAARARRAAERDEATWVARAANQLSAADEAALAARAGKDPVVEHMRAVTVPHTQAEQDALEASVLAVLDEQSPTRVVQLAPRRQRALALSAAVLAAAAAILLIVRAPGQPQLPRYEASLTGTDVAVRSAEPVPAAPRARVSEGALVTLTAQPVDALPPGLAPAARLFVVQGASATALSVPIEVADSGAVRLTAPYASLFGARRGELDLLLFIAAPAALPDADEALAQAEAPDRGVQVLRFPLAL
jgi:hypothetical protein